MAKKISDKELNNVSGGCGGGGNKTEVTVTELPYNCPNPNCKKSFYVKDAKVIGDSYYCPDCGTFVGKIPHYTKQ